MASDAAAEVDRLTNLALALPPALRELLAFRLWESLHPEESWPLAPEQLDEIQRRSKEVEAGNVETVDGEEAIREIRARLETRRR